MGKTKADLLLHPIRIHIMTEFSGRDRTSQELAEALPAIPQATLYRQIKVLLDGGILVIAKEERIKGAVQRTYRVAQGGSRLSAEELRVMSAEDHLRYFTLYTAALIDTFSDYIHTTDLQQVPESGLTYNRAVVYLTDAERAAFTAELNGLVGRMLAVAPAPERQRFTLASIVIPDEKDKS